MSKCEKEEQFGAAKEGYWYDGTKKCLAIKAAKVLPLAVTIE